jgi:hypothetical protein
VTWESTWQPMATRPFDRLRVVEGLPTWMLAIRYASAVVFVVMGGTLGGLILSSGGEGVIVGLVIVAACLIAPLIALVVTVAGRRAVTTVDETGFSLRYSRLRREVRVAPRDILSVRACSLPSMPMYGRNWWLSYAGRGRQIIAWQWRISPVDLTPQRAFSPRDLRTGEPVDILGVVPCGVGSQGIVLIARAGDDTLGVLTDHAEEVLDALTTLLASVHARPDGQAGRRVLPAHTES